MPIIFNNWKLIKIGFEISLESWVPFLDHSRFRSMKIISKFYTYKSNYSNIMKDNKKTEFYQYIIPLNGLKIKKSISFGNGWSFSLNDETFFIIINSKIPHQSIQEIENIINEINTGIQIVLPASSSEIISQIINESIKSGSYVKLPIQIKNDIL